jgi:hypothetical protein
VLEPINQRTKQAADEGVFVTYFRKKGRMSKKITTPEQAIARLVERGCPRPPLMIAVERLRRAAAPPAKGRGAHRQYVKQQAEQLDRTLRAATAKVERLVLDRVAVDMLPELKHLHLSLLLWSKSMARLKGLHAPAVDHARAYLVRLVYESTKKWHDDEVSLLVGYVLDRVIDPITHRMWRKRHAEDLLCWASLKIGAEILQSMRSLMDRPNANGRGGDQISA